jgi:hypothetical protein
MSTANAEEIYERYIKELPADLRLLIVEIVVRELAAQTPERGKEKEQPRDLMDLHGLGKEIWDDIDAQAYVDHLRTEWDHRS